MTMLALVIFKESLSRKDKDRLKTVAPFQTIIAPAKLKSEISALGRQWESLEEFVGAGNIYEASNLAEELSLLKFSDGSHISRSFMYKGYELWWLHYENLFLYFCLPYTQYKKLLEYLKNFKSVYFYCLPYKSLFSCYLQAHKIKMEMLKEKHIKSPIFLPFGVFIQILLTLMSMLVLMIKKRRALLFTGDKFEKDKDYDFRMKFIYEELRQRDIPFVEFIRSLESWKTIIKHAIKRRRPIIYSEGVTFVGRFCSFISGGHRRARQKFGDHTTVSEKTPEMRFKFLVATQYLLGVYDDIWAIRIMKFILWAIGVRVAIITAATERNFHTVLGCKLGGIPTIGILHGVASRFYNVYDFLPTYDGIKMLSVDKYGLWSNWWKEYYSKYSKVYHPEQLYVSGPMRPLIKKPNELRRQRQSGPIRLLFVSEQLAVPEEVLPYLIALMDKKDLSIYLTCRPYRDGFETWLRNNCPEILDKIGHNRILKNGIIDAISKCDMVVGSHSTAVLEALLDLKPMAFFLTKKWGDYFELKGYNENYKFFAENPSELIDRIRKSNEIPVEILESLRERFFGDPYKNGSKWVVDQAGEILRRTS